MTERLPTRLLAVAVGAGAVDQLSKLVIRAVLAVGEQHHLGLGIGLVRLERTEAGSITATFVVGGIFVLAGLLGARLERPGPPTWLAGGLLVGGAVSSFVELAISGDTMAWLALPLHAVVSLAYLEMLAGATGLFFHIGQARRRSRSVVTNG
jgi:hypothetical protein